MTSTVDLIVIGAGASGIAAAYAASAGGADVVVLDERNASGGWLKTSITELQDPPRLLPGQHGFEAAAAGAQILATNSIDYRPESIVWGLFENLTVGVVGPDGAYQLSAERIILATGSTDIVWPFRGWTLPGIMTTHAARVFMHQHFVLPGRQVAVIGPDAQSSTIAGDLAVAGANVVTRLESPDGVKAGGETAIEWIDAHGNREPVDAVILAFGALPDPELARHARADLVYSTRDGCHVAMRDNTMSTSVEGLYLVGDAGGCVSVNRAVAQGLVAGYAATGSNRLGPALSDLESIVEDRQEHHTVGHPAQIPADTLIDREEQVSAAAVRDAISNGALSLNDVKRRTRAGMGASQGRDTEYVIARMIHEQAGIPLDQLTPMTARPPARLVSLADLAKIAVVSA